MQFLKHELVFVTRYVFIYKLLYSNTWSIQVVSPLLSLITNTLFLNLNLNQRTNSMTILYTTQLLVGLATHKGNTTLGCLNNTQEQQHPL